MTRNERSLHVKRSCPPQPPTRRRAGWPRASALPEMRALASGLLRWGPGLQRLAQPCPGVSATGHRVGPRPMNPNFKEPWLQGSQVTPASVGPRLSAACPGRPFLSFGREGGVIYREDENLSRKFVPINIPVPGSSSPRRGGGRADPAAASAAECSPLARGKRRRGSS